MKRALAVTLVLATVAPSQLAYAGKGDDEEESSDDEDEEKASKSDKGGEKDDKDQEESSSDDDEEEESKKDDEEDEETDDDGLRSKQNLSGRDEGTEKKVTEFEKDRFFVDKVDTEATEKGTLVQGSIASSSFFYGETGGAYPGGVAGNNTGPRRLFTELRLQTDFRHIAASRWEARIDARGRFVGQPGNDVAVGATPNLTVENRIQSGLLGENELDLRELWLIRSGKRSDVFIGRQFIPDLGGLKIDGLRVDYAKSSKLTLIGFGGLLPIRGSRSLTTDYQELENDKGEKAGRFVATGGFGGAYRTPASYGAIGAVIQAPLKMSAESPRLYVTSNGYLRKGAKLDLYHYVLMDLLGSAASESTSHIQLTNLSGGANFKPNPRLRLTAAFHRVDTETLAVQAGAFLNQPDANGLGATLIQSDTYLKRIATNTARAGVSAGLGKNQRFEISTALSYRFRPSFTLESPDKTVKAELPEASSIEVWGSFVDRRSIKNARIGIEASRSFAVGQLAYQRSVMLIGRLFVLREIANGKGEWEAEASFSDVRDTVIGMNLGCAMVSQPADCYGTSTNKLYQVGGQVFYRLKRDWFGIATLHVLRTTNLRSDKVADPATMGITGFIRIAKRF